MNMKLWTLAAAALALASCDNNSTSYISQTGSALGTTYNLCYEADSSLEGAILDRLARYNMSMSTYNPESLLSRINRGETDTVDHDFRTVFNEAQKIYRLSGGVFDITLRPVSHVWHFGEDHPDTITLAEYNDTQARAAELMKHLGMDKTRIEGNRIVREDSMIQFDANALAEGHGIDLMAEVLDRHGIKNYMVELGGELHIKGLNPKGQKWRIGIDKPKEGVLAPRENHHIIAVTDCAISTSGSYRQYYYRADGVRLSHTIDPRTCSPSTHGMITVTIVGPSTMVTDALSTTCMVLGPDDARTLISKWEGVEMFMIYADEDGAVHEYMTDGYKKMVIR